MIVQRFLIVLMLASISLATGCASKSIQGDYSLDTAKDEGVVVVSVSHDSWAGRKARGFFYLNGGSLSENGHMLVSLPDAFPGIPGGSDLKDGYGKLYVLSLPAGRHSLRSWQIEDLAGASRIRPEKEPVPLEFQVVAGKVQYLGNLHVNLRQGKDLFGRTIVGNGYPEIREQQGRDLAIFEKKYPQLKGRASVDLLPQGPWVPDRPMLKVLNLPPEKIVKDGFSLLPPNEKGWAVAGKSPNALTLLKAGVELDESVAIQAHPIKLPEFGSIDELVRLVNKDQAKDNDSRRFKLRKHEVVAHPKNGTYCAKSYFAAEDNAATKRSENPGFMILEALSLVCAHPNDKTLGVHVGYSHRYYPEHADSAFVEKATAVLESLEFSAPR